MGRVRRNSLWRKIGAEWEHFHAYAEEFIDAREKIITLGYNSGTYKGNGKSMSAPTTSIWTLENGKVIKFVQYIDTLKVVSALT